MSKKSFSDRKKYKKEKLSEKRQFPKKDLDHSSQDSLKKVRLSQKRTLELRIKECDRRKKELIRYLKRLNKDLKENRISISEYKHAIDICLKSESVEHWLRYYDKQKNLAKEVISELEYKRDRLKPNVPVQDEIIKKFYNVPKLFILIFLIFISLPILVFLGNYTGFTVFEPQIVSFELNTSWNISNSFVRVSMAGQVFDNPVSEFIVGENVLVNLTQFNFNKTGEAYVDLIVDGALVDSKKVIISEPIATEAKTTNAILPSNLTKINFTVNQTSEDVTIDFRIKNSAGSVIDSNIELEGITTKWGLRKGKGGLRYAKIKKGKYNIRIIPKGVPVKEVRMRDVSVDKNSSSFVKIDDVPETGGFTEIYAIDPTKVNFSNATVTATAKGSVLYKCKGWDFTKQYCYGHWVKLMDITPGQNYSFILTPEDPGFGEGDDYSGWAYRQSINITDNSGAVLEEYQVMLRIDTASLISQGKLKSDCSDIRFANSSNSAIPFYIDESPGLTCNRTDTLIWVQVPRIPASGTETIYMYYGNADAPSLSNIVDTFTYSSPKEIYFAIGDFVSRSNIDVISYVDNNQITLNSNGETTIQNESGIYTGFDAVDIAAPDSWNVTGPWAFGCSSSNCDTPNPISFAGTEFIRFVDRGGANKEWFVYAPFSNGTVYWFNASSGGSFSSTPLKTLNITKRTLYTVTDADGIDDQIFIINSTTPILLAFEQGSSDTTTHVPASNDAWGISEDIAFAYSGTVRTLCESDAACSTTTRNGPYRENLGGNTNGQAPASHVNGTKYFGYGQTADGDGAESLVFWPEWELSKVYYSPVAVQYMAGALTEGGTDSCTWYNGSTETAYTPTGSLSYPNPKKILLTGNPSAPYDNYAAAGSRINCTYPFFIYLEPNNEDEANLLSYKQARQYVWPEPSINYGSEVRVPFVNLVSPPDGNLSSIGDVTFTCNATSVIGLANLTLFVWNTTDVYYTNTRNISGTANQSSWNLIGMPNGDYSWNCRAYDTAGNPSWADSNWSLVIGADTQYPVYSQDTDDSGGEVTEGAVVNVSVYWEDNSQLGVGEFYHNASGTMVLNGTYYFGAVTAGWYNTSIDTSGEGGKTICWKQYANDSSGNKNNSMSNDTHCFYVNRLPTITTVNDAPDPVKVGDDVQFTVNWNDLDPGEQVKIHICKSVNLSGQTCIDGSWCDSTNFTPNDPESCNYTTTGSDKGTNNYYAFVCDDNNACSAPTSGTFTVDNTPPSYSNDTDDSGGEVTEGTQVNVSVKWTDNLGLSTAKLFIRSNTSDYIIGETGQVNLSNFQFKTIAFKNNYASTPVVIATPVTQNDGDNGLIPAIRMVNRTHFEISLCQDVGLATCNTTAGEETVHYFVFDVNKTQNYNWIDVGTVTVKPDGGSNTITWGVTFDNPPYVFATANTYKQGGNVSETAWVDDSETSTTGTTSFIGCTHQGVGDNCDTWTPSETFAYVAIDPTSIPSSTKIEGFQSGVEAVSNSQWTPVTFSPSFTIPNIMVTQNDDAGSQDPQYPWAKSVTANGASIRYCEQDGYNDCDTHTAENVAWFAVEQGYIYVFNETETCTLNGQTDSCNLTINTTGEGGNEICWKQYANDSSDNWNNSMFGTTHCFYVVPDKTPPNITLITPTNGTKYAEGNITFTCNATDNYALSNLTLYIWNTTDVYYTNTRDVSGIINQSSWNLTGIPSGDYSWNCLAYDIANNPGWADQNKSFTVNSLPSQVILYQPANDSSTIELKPTLYWYNATDTDGDTRTYQLQVDDSIDFAPPLIVNKTAIDEGNNLTNYTLTTELETNIRYYWRVRAFDGTGYGLWSQIWHFDVNPSVIISSLVNLVDFGATDLGQTNDTTDDSPRAFVLQNDGNVFVNLSINSSALWSSVGLNTSYYQFKVDDRNETGSFNLTSSQTNFMNMSSSFRFAAKSLNYSDPSDTCVIDIRIITPETESPGVKSANLMIRAEEEK